jgi:hypothetical protein
MWCAKKSFKVVYGVLYTTIHVFFYDISPSTHLGQSLHIARMIENLFQKYTISSRHLQCRSFTSTASNYGNFSQSTVRGFEATKHNQPCNGL